MSGHRIRTIVCAGLVAGSIAAGSAHAITIDRLEGATSLDVNNFARSAAVSTTTSAAIGGTRSGLAWLVSETGEAYFRIDTGVYSAGELHFDERSASAGGVELYYDGNTTVGIEAFNGLHNLDLTADGGTAFLFDVLFYDWPGEAPLDLSITLYDGRDASGATWSQGNVQVRERFEGGVTKRFSLPFAALSSYGPGGPADLRSIGAIKVAISDGGSARDLIVGPLRTDGRCTHVPVDGVVLDACGVCGGDGTSCTGSCTQEEASVEVRKKSKQVSKAARVLRDRVGRFTKLATECSGKNYQDLVKKADAQLAKLNGVIKETTTLTVCPGSICREESTALERRVLRRISTVLYRYAKQAKLTAIADCHVAHHESEQKSKTTEGYRDDLDRAIKNLPPKILSCQY